MALRSSKEFGKAEIGCLGSIILIIIVLIFIGKMTGFFERSEEKKRIEQQKLVAQLEEKRGISFLNNIEQHYQTLLTAYNNNNFKQASNQLTLFRKYGKLDYKNVADINREVISTLERKVKKLPASMARENLEIYKQLLALDPQNQRYKQKVAHYTKKVKNIAEAKAKKETRQQSGKRE